MKGIFLLLLALACMMSLAAQTVDIEIRPSLKLPLGPLDDGTKVFTNGGGVDLALDFGFREFEGLRAFGCFGYGLFGTSGDSRLSSVSASVGPSYDFPPFGPLSLRLSAAGGGSAGFYDDDTGLSPYAAARFDASWRFTRAFSLGLGAGAEWTNYCYGASVSLGGTLALGARRLGLEIKEIVPDPIFPVFYSYYDDHPLGYVTLKNAESGTARNVHLSFYVPQYMDGPKECASIAELQPGEIQRKALVAVFTDAILGVTEGTKVTARIAIEYEYLGESLKIERSQSIVLYDRNALTWDDDRKAAAFVTAKDPAILRYAKGVSGVVREEGPASMNGALLAAIGLFQSLDGYGLRYVVDPKSPYSSASSDRGAVDFVQFPRQTLEYKAGDCDDLSVLYCALLESVGVGTAFITVPGHIFVAAAIGDPAAASGSFPAAFPSFIISEGECWVPIEITMLKDGFLKAMRKGALEWKEAGSLASLVPTHSAWMTYPPVGIPGDSSLAKTPDMAQAARAFESGFAAFADAEIGPQLESIKVASAKKQDDTALSNRIGALYARFGRFTEAVPYFEKSSAAGFSPAMVNLATVARVQKQPKVALALYKKAFAKRGTDWPLLAQIAKLQAETADEAGFKESMARLRKGNSELADQVAGKVDAFEPSGGEKASASGSGDLLEWRE